MTDSTSRKFLLVVDSSAKEPYWLESIGIVAAAKPGQNELGVNENFAQIAAGAASAPAA